MVSNVPSSAPHQTTTSPSETISSIHSKVPSSAPYAELQTSPTNFPSTNIQNPTVFLNSFIPTSDLKPSINPIYVTDIVDHSVSPTHLNSQSEPTNSPTSKISPFHGDHQANPSLYEAAVACTVLAVLFISAGASILYKRAYSRQPLPIIDEPVPTPSSEFDLCVESASAPSPILPEMVCKKDPGIYFSLKCLEWPKRNGFQKVSEVEITEVDKQLSKDSD